MSQIRKARIGEENRLVEIEHSAAQRFLDIKGYEWLAANPGIDLEEHRRLIEIGLCWVALQEQRISGFLQAGTLMDCFHIMETSVELAAQGKGLARALIEALIDTAHQRGLDKITLTTFRDVPFNQPLYAHLGFVELDSPPPLIELLMIDEEIKGLKRADRVAMVLDISGINRK